MDRDALLFWILVGSFSMNAVQFKLWWNHARECRDFRARFATAEQQIKSMSHEIGDHETGLRGSIHELRNQISPMYIDWQRRKQ
jgi:hypothetical protein